MVDTGQETFGKKVMIVIFWVTVVFGFLYSPLIKDALTEDNAINVFLYSGVVDQKIFQQFEQETGIHVNVAFFESNEELFAKLQATKGAGYDLVMPSDFMVSQLIKSHMLQPIDKSKLNFFDRLHPAFLNTWYDPGNVYSVPIEWYALGLGINKDFFKGKDLPEASWKSLFDVRYMPYSIGLISDARELIMLAMLYKYGTIRSINAQEVEELKQLLVEQKKRVEAYTDFKGDYLLASGNCSMALISCVYMWKLLEDNENLAFLMPKEAVYGSIENYVIPVRSHKTEKVYKLLNFLFRYDVQKHNFESVASFSTCKDADFIFEKPVLKDALAFLQPDSGIPFCLMRDTLTDDQVNDIWIAVKGS